MDPTELLQCPACGTDVTAQTACPHCGIDLSGEEASRLRDLLDQVAGFDQEWSSLAARRREAVDEIEALRSSIVGPSPRFDASAPSAPTRSATEWNVELVRTWLLWLGVALLTLSALTFTVVAWARLGPGGRAGLLAGGTALACGLAVALRRRLPATAQALTALGIALALVDWQALRVAGMAPGISDAAWWSLGTATVGAFSLLFGRVTSRDVARVTTAVLFPVSGFLLVIVVAGATWSLALGLSILAAALVLARAAMNRRVDDALTADVLRIEAAGAWATAVVASLVAASVTEGVADAATPAAVVLSCALAPMLATIRPAGTRTPRSRSFTAALAIAAPMAAVLVLVTNVLGSRGLTTFAVVLGAGALVFGPWVPGPWRAGALGAGAVAVVPGAGLALAEAAVAIAGPLAWLGDVWTTDLDRLARDLVEGPRATNDFSAGWTSVGSLAASALAVGALAFTPESRRPGLGTGELAAGAGVLGISACSLAPVAGGGTVLSAFLATTATTIVVVAATLIVDRRRQRWTNVAVALAILAALPAVGWAAATSASSVAGLAILVGVTGVAATLAATPGLRVAYAGVTGLAATALVGVVFASDGLARGPIGFAMAITAGLVLLVGVFGRRDTPDGLALELAGAAGLAVGVGVSSDSSTWLAGTLTATVPMLALGVLRADRRGVDGVAAMLAALAATWAWLAAAAVHLLEAYTLPAAAVALAAGAIAWKASRASSWWMLGPAIVVALGPTLMSALVNDDAARAVAVAIGGLVIVFAGAARRLQAPIVLGSAALLVLAVDTLGPTAAGLPRWLVLALAGTLLLYVGATFERRRENVRRLVGRFSSYA